MLKWMLLLSRWFKAWQSMNCEHLDYRYTKDHAHCTVLNWKQPISNSVWMDLKLCQNLGMLIPLQRIWSIQSLMLFWGWTHFILPLFPQLIKHPFAYGHHLIRWDLVAYSMFCTDVPCPQGRFMISSNGRVITFYMIETSQNLAIHQLTVSEA